MKKLFIDIETYSERDIKTCGAYKYMECPKFEILIIGYAINDGPVKIIDLLGDKIDLHNPDTYTSDALEFMLALQDPEVLLVAHNATFERLAFKRVGFDMPRERWYCTAVKAAYCGLPFSLDDVSKRLNLQDKKLATGKALIKYFSCPCKATKVNGGRTRNYPEHAPEKWEMYKEYNKYDVLAEREIYYKLEKYSLPTVERDLYALDQKINDNGILVDTVLANNAIQVDTIVSEQLSDEVKQLTGVDNPNSNAQIKKWLESVTGDEFDSLAKDVMDGLKEKYANNAQVSKLLTLRNQLSKTSIKKFYAMTNCAMADNRVRGTFQFYGANRTGRWAGRLLQLQNLARNHIENIEIPRSLVREANIEALQMLYDDIPDVLSQLIRTGIIAPDGKILSVADFSAIEARVISWLANEEWRMEVFHGDGKIYEATGAKMFNVPIKAITKGSELRQKSKISELALGYGGAVGAMRRMGGERMGLSDIEMMNLTRKWRQANPKIVELWGELEECVTCAIKYRKQIVGTPQNLVFDCDDTALTITLPSGRSLYYYKPRIVDNCIEYEGVIQTTKQWGHIETYGGKLTENVVQAIARDLLAYAMLQLDKAGFKITMHVHDEVIAEIDKDGTEKAVYDKMVKIMSTPPEWAKDLPLNADGYLTDFYKKD